MADAFDALLDPDFTYTLSKYSCIRAAYFPHVVFSYLTAISGIACFISRVVPFLRPAHYWFGRVYILSMLWTMATSLLIHNTGLPPAALISFVWVMAGLTLGWVVINIHQVVMQRQAMALVQDRIKLGGLQGSLEAMVGAAKKDIADRKTFVQRFFSLKTLHALLFFTSWINIVGRIFASNQSGDFTCHTFPYYKQIDTREFLGGNVTLTPVPVHDPHFERLPWARMGLTTWSVALSLGPFLGGALLGAVFCLVASRRRKVADVESIAPQAVRRATDSSA